METAELLQNDDVQGDVDSKEDVIDAKGHMARKSKKLKLQCPPIVRVLGSVESDNYYMNHRGHGMCLIFNHEEFRSQTKLEKREGTAVDAISIQNCFTNLGFQVKKYQDLKASAIKSTLQKVSKEDHSKYDCFVCFILTHGSEGKLYGNDKSYATSEIFTPFYADLCPSLAGKPKIFFIQACQGQKMDSGTEIMIDPGFSERTDSSSEAPSCSLQKKKIPVLADFLLVYASPPGYFSWRNPEKGSWFIRSLCKIISQYSESTDLLGIITMVCHSIAYELESNSAEKQKSGKKQVPHVTSTLTRKVYPTTKPSRKRSKSV